MNMDDDKMKSLEKRLWHQSPVLKSITTAAVVIGIVFLLGEKHALISMGLAGMGGLLSASYFIPADLTCERVWFRFLAFQSICAGFYWWASGVELAEVNDWIVGFVFIIFVVLPIAFVIIQWSMRKEVV